MRTLTVLTLLAGIMTALLSAFGKHRGWFTAEQVVFFNFSSALLMVTSLAFFLLAVWYRGFRKSEG